MSQTTGGAPSPQGSLENEIVWIARRGFILFRCWTTPLRSVRVNTFSADDGVSARAFALFLIAALVFAVRGESPDQILSPSGAQHTLHTTFTAIAGGFAIVMSMLLNVANYAFKGKINEPTVLSAYASTILVLFFYIVIDVLFTDAGWYNDLAEYFWFYDPGAGEYKGKIVLGCILASAFALVCLLAKARIFDKSKVSLDGIVNALGLTAGSGAIAAVVALMSSSTFSVLVNYFNEHHS
jgi:hypothetical protein